MPIQESMRPRRQNDLSIEQQVPGLNVVLVPSTGKVLIANDTGRFLLEHSDGGKSVPELIQAMAAQWPDVNRDELEKDVEDFLTAAADRGAVTWV